MDFNIIRIARVVMNVTDLNASRDFYVNALGFIETASSSDWMALRGLEEHCHHSLLLKKADKPGVHAVSYKVWEDAHLDALASFFKGKGSKVLWKEADQSVGIGRTLCVEDPSGIPLEFFVEMEGVERCIQKYDLYKGARVQRIDHINCMVPDVEAAVSFYTKELGFRVSEYTATEDDRTWAAWLHRKPTVHDVAFMNGEGPRLHHVGFWLSDPMSLIHCCDVMASMGYADHIERGPGRHGLSNAFFLYIRDPDGNRIELYNGDYLTSDPDFKPVKWDINDPRRQTFWGHKAPDSWFNEATSFLDVETGKPVKQKSPTLAQRKPDFVT
ncbi:3,4-dihydroxyphenylacetate 2,3-dioxygenase [Fictibacillus phosphorivorans]|uniref:3,4-dihydroxyphenylacetate 2,3-dioxygenase n=1 Tax=Fictibacillus phosphorivorans TaxID=1221500 RepID=UPI002041E682|nr:3,4-dihydroxyphenylacetate 2,3-dioxygenase [Fictibacillus phosphorivorans]MCM3718628.1 3,4-dihydroxyphenylacetate 2,3-dioxygenase [Fictibacillus phosphorivorans]MCM3776251.1 3,4-dihydroxyphenylacetate 2,3-dioxygenase [Fictibacillus phosphorivorans]